MSEPSGRDSDENHLSSSEELSVRRSACDRCRTHKLKCNRDDNSNLHTVCRRCSKAGAICKTSATAPIGRPTGPFRQQYEQRRHKRRRAENLTSKSSSIHRNETQAPTPLSSMAEDVSESGFVSIDNDQGFLTPLSAPANNPSIPSNVLLKDVESSLDAQHLTSHMIQSASELMSESRPSSIFFAPTTDQRENVVQRIANLHSDLVSDLHISRGSQRIDECAWVTSMPEFADSCNFPIGRMLNNSTRLLEILHHFVDTPTTTGQQSSVHCDTPTLFSLLTCYVYLVRVYRYTFTCIAKSVPILKTSTVKLPSLFPGLHLAGFSLEPHIDLQIRVLVQVAETMLGRIDRALGISNIPEQQSTASLLHQTGFPYHLVHEMLQVELVEEHKDGILIGYNEPLKDIFANLGKI